MVVGFVIPVLSFIVSNYYYKLIARSNGEYCTLKVLLSPWSINEYCVFCVVNLNGYITFVRL